MEVEIMNGPIFDVARKLANLKEQKEELELQLKEINGKIQIVNDQLSELMLIEKLQLFNMDGKTFYASNLSIPKILNDDAFAKWLKDHGEDGILRLTVHHSTLQAWWKEKGEQYEEELKERKYVSVFEKRQIKMKKA
jgi:hypothetical protein